MVATRLQPGCESDFSRALNMIAIDRHAPHKPYATLEAGIHPSGNWTRQVDLMVHRKLAFA
jgi:hypothetical protein